MKKARTYSRYTADAARLLGTQIAAGRRERGWTAKELAERVGVTPATLSRIEKGDPGVGLGVAFEAAALTGVPLFAPDAAELGLAGERARERLALLPQRVRRPPRRTRDDF